MLIAKQKRRENIAEYILYLWQLEDMLRALELSPERIRETLVEPQTGIAPEQREALFMWYTDLANLLRTEGKERSGHLEHTLHLVADLDDLHRHLLNAPVGREQGYDRIFAPLAAELPRLKAAMARDTDRDPATISDMEACFRALYLAMLYRLRKGRSEGTAKGLPPADETAEERYVRDVLQLVSPVVARLSAIHGAAERGELDLYKEMA